MKRCLLIFMFFLTLIGSAQEYMLAPINTLILEADLFVGVDDYKSLYYTRNQQLIKRNGSKAQTYSALELGEIQSVDIINPLKIVVFYKTSNTVVVLDNTLTEIRRIAFNSISNFRNVGHAFYAGDRKLWIYNIDLQRLEIYDWGQAKVDVEFPPLVTTPEAMTTNFNFSWVADDERLLTYNNYGNLLEERSFKTITSIAESRGDLILFSDNQLYYKRKNTTQFTALKLPDILPQQLYLNDEILYIYSHQKLLAFQIKPVK